MNKLIQLIKLYSFSEPDEASLLKLAQEYSKNIVEAKRKLKIANQSFFVKDSRRIFLGNGIKVWEAARSAVFSLQPFNLKPFGKTACYPAPLAEDSIVAISAYALGVWIAPVSYVSEIINEETKESSSSGFAYTTLPSHVMFGKEWFRVDYSHQTGDVYFHLSSISRPDSIWTYLIYPIIRIYQVKFQKIILQAMKQATERLAGSSIAEYRHS